MPKSKPEILIAPMANYIAVRGQGNPDEEGGVYQNVPPAKSGGMEIIMQRQ